ncbi:tripartite tricarboxylate transporter substrate binding protein [Ramlibacter sp. AW1]|uniref:Tripartite tricarboxylate transporter substrate binding protein n=1 Tax=Ramlibacter aurantiacus TaxID=2801330 RepID=A0A936ZNG2_9BURK|nr:tripartite tricarboxylate transporter substrate binding protein [Ramlibacter aurantiacus]MBL0422972.1 tripartite tricarboxylate transporter substrate binding protein [Ramlibacter aurantiacus]
MKRFLASIMAAWLCLAAASAALADTYPSRPITFIVPFTAGPADTLMRAFADRAGKELGQPLVVVNRPGAGGSMAPAAMSKTAAPDGYTISMFSASLLFYPYLNKVDWSAPTDFTYIIGVTSDALAVHVPEGSPFKTIEEVVAFGKANPGRLTYATPGVATTMHLVAENLFRKLGIQATHVPYKGTAEVVRALLAGEVMMSVDLAGGNYTQVQGGKARYLMQFNEEPAPYMKNVPTAKAKGFDTASSTLGIVGPKGMPPEIVQRLHAAFAKALDEPGMVRILDDLKKERWYRTPAEYAAWARETDKTARSMVEAANLQAK